MIEMTGDPVHTTAVTLNACTSPGAGRNRGPTRHRKCQKNHDISTHKTPETPNPPVVVGTIKISKILAKKKKNNLIGMTFLTL